MKETGQYWRIWGEISWVLIFLKVWKIESTEKRVATAESSLHFPESIVLEISLESMEVVISRWCRLCFQDRVNS